MKLFSKLWQKFKGGKHTCCDGKNCSCQTIIFNPSKDEQPKTEESKVEEKPVVQEPELEVKPETQEPEVEEPQVTEEVLEEPKVEQEQPKLECLCLMDGCRNKASKKGMCHKHYLEYYKRVIEPTKPICVIEGCTNHSRSRGLCKNHYEFLQKRGVFKKFPDGLRPEVLSEIYYEYTKNS